MMLIQLFWSFFKIGLFSIGGGLAAMPLIQHEVVELHNWLTLTEFSHLVTIAEMTPGPLGINSATFVGTRICGPLGAIVATLGCITPSCIIVFFLCWVYFKFKNMSVIQGILSGLRPAVVALIAGAGLTIFILAVWGENGFIFGLEYINYISVTLFALSIFCLQKFKLNPICVMMASGIIGGTIYMFI